MREIEFTNQFKKDWKKISKADKKAEGLLEAALNLLCADKELPAKYCDHPLKGVWRHWRDLHLKPDLLLIYRKVGNDTLQLSRIGSHSELF